jgi:hypothetical protein
MKTDMKTDTKTEPTLPRARAARAVPFLIAGFMLTPFLLWAGLFAAGLRGPKPGFDGPEAVVLLLASLPLAGLFWIRNLREMGDSLAADSRLRLARALTAALPAAVLLIGGIGLAWLAGLDRPATSLALVGAAVVAVAALAWLATGRRGEAATARPRGSRRPGASDVGTLLVIANVTMALVLLAWYWTPAVLFYAALALTPVVFLGVIAVAQQDDGAA